MDKRAFPSFYREHMNRIHRFVFYRVGGRREVAEDLTQDIFIKAYEAFERYDPAISQSAWIYTIARNTVINHYAKDRPGVTLEEIEDSVWVAKDAREQYASDQESQRLLEALDRLDKEEAKLLRMKHLEGWSFEDLAEVFGKSAGALRVQAMRALQKVKNLIKR